MIDIWVAEPFFHSVSYLFRHTFIYFPEMRNKSICLASSKRLVMYVIQYVNFIKLLPMAAVNVPRNLEIWPKNKQALPLVIFMMSGLTMLYSSKISINISDWKKDRR